MLEDGESDAFTAAGDEEDEEAGGASAAEGGESEVRNRFVVTEERAVEIEGEDAGVDAGGEAGAGTLMTVSKRRGWLLLSARSCSTEQLYLREMEK